MSVRVHVTLFFLKEIRKARFSSTCDARSCQLPRWNRGHCTLHVKWPTCLPSYWKISVTTRPIKTLGLAQLVKLFLYTDCGNY